MPIKITDLNYVYSKGTPFQKAALKNVNLEIADGEFWGVIGHTGSGKSTLFSHLNALTRIQSGKIEIDEFTLIGNGGKKPKRKHRPDYKALRARVGMVFQYPEYQLFAETVFKDVAFGLKNFNKNLSDDEIAQAVEDSIKIVGLDYYEIKDKSPFDLSGGQKRRVAIAGVLVTKPHILILDEPAAGLDPKGKNEIMELLHKIHREWCKTVIIVSHDMDEIADNCTQAAVISEGKVFACDAPAKIFSRADELKALGLDIPLTAKVSAKLAESGVIIDSDCTVEDFSRKVLEVFNGNGGEANA